MSSYTDRELLELAAEASGYDYECVSHTGCVEHDQHQIRTEKGNLVDWNPLTDNGDAFTLALNLRIKFERHPIQPFVAAFSPAIIGRVEEPEGNCVHSATRRAIVQLAAAIGEMKRQERE